MPLYLRESVSPSSPNYIDPFQSFSGFQVGAGQDCTQRCGGGDYIFDDSFMAGSSAGSSVAGYDTFGIAPGVAEGGSGAIYGYSFTAGDPERALTTDTLRLDIVPEPSAASLLALGLIGIIGLALWRRRGAEVSEI